FNRTATAPSSACLPACFEAQVERTPEAIAVEDELGCLSYRELNQRSNQLAHYLRGLGGGAEKLGGICSSRSREMMGGLLGVLKAGGAYVPLDPGYPKDRLAYMLEDSGITVLITEQSLLAELPATQAQVVCLDREEARLAEQRVENLPAQAEGDNL